MVGSILHRMILAELVKVFLLALVALTGIILLAGVVAEASQRGLSPLQVLAIIPLIIPNTLPYTIPATTLFACCLVYGRLAADNEIIAIKCAGINVLYVIWPAAVLGVTTSAITLGLYIKFIPHTQLMLQQEVIKDVEEVLFGMLKSDSCLNGPKINYSIYVKQMQDRKLIGPVFKRKDAHGQYDLFAMARDADLSVIKQKNGKFMVRVHMRDGEIYSVKESHHGYFANHTFEEETPDLGTDNRPLRAREMEWPQIEQRLRELATERVQVDGEIGHVKDAMARPAAAAELGGQCKNLEYKRDTNKREECLLHMELAMRPALALGGLFFALVGCPVGIWFSKSDYLSAFVTCFLPIVFLYYPLLLGGISLAKNGRVEPMLALWVANVVIGIIAAALLRALTRN